MSLRGHNHCVKRGMEDWCYECQKGNIKFCCKRKNKYGTKTFIKKTTK